MKIQPAELATKGSAADQMAAFQIHGLSGVLPRRVSQRPSTAISAIAVPAPTMIRNPQ